MLPAGIPFNFGSRSDRIWGHPFQLAVRRDTDISSWSNRSSGPSGGSACCRPCRRCTCRASRPYCNGNQISCSRTADPRGAAVRTRRACLRACGDPSRTSIAVAVALKAASAVVARDVAVVPSSRWNHPSEEISVCADRVLLQPPRFSAVRRPAKAVSSRADSAASMIAADIARASGRRCVSQSMAPNTLVALGHLVSHARIDLARRRLVAI